MSDTAAAKTTTVVDTIKTTLDRKNEERNSLMNANKCLNVAIDHIFKNLPKKPRMSSDEYNATISELELSKADGLSKQEEKDVDAQISSLRREMKSIDGYESLIKEIESKRKEREANDQKIKSISDEINELYQAQHDQFVINLVKEGTGETITKDDIYTEEFELTPENIESIKKFRGDNISVQKNFGASYYCKDNKITLRGKKTNVMNYKLHLYDCCNPTSVTINKNINEIFALISHKMRFVYIIQDISGASLNITASKNEIEITGGKNAVARAQKELANFFNNTMVINIDSFTRNSLLKNKAADLIVLRDQAQGYITFDKGTNETLSTYSIYGLEEDIKNDLKALNQYMLDHPRVDHIYTVEIPNMITYLIGTKGEHAKAMIKETGAQFDFGNKESRSDSFTITGLQSEVDAAIKLVDEYLVQYKKEHGIVNIPHNVVKCLINDKSKALKKIESDASARLFVNKNDVCEISGTEEQVIAAKTMLEDYMKTIVTKEYTIPEATVSRFVGEKGSAINLLRESIPSVIDIEKSGTIIVSATAENIEKFTAFIDDWNKKCFTEVFTVEPVAIGAALIGTKGVILKEIQTLYTVEMNINEQKQISIQGLEENVEKAKADCIERVEKYLKENVVVSCSPDLIHNCSAFKRSEMEKIEKVHENKVKIFALMKDGGFKITGDEEDVQIVKAQLQSLINNYKGYETIYTSCPKEHIGVLVGKKGAHLIKIQEDNNVDIHVLENAKENNIQIFGKTEDIEEAVEYIKEYLKTNIKISKVFSLTQKQVRFLFDNKMESVNEMNKLTGVNVSIPENTKSIKGLIPVTLFGNEEQLKQAEPLFNQIISGQKKMKYSFTSQDLSTLMNAKNFYSERLELANNSHISIINNDQESSIEIIGTKDNIQNTYFDILKALSVYAPEHYYTIPVSTTIISLVNKNASLFDEIKKTYSIEVFVNTTSKCIHIISISSPMIDVKSAFDELLVKLNKECAFIHVEQVFIPHIIGTQGKVIKKLMDDYKTSIDVDNDTCDIIITGSEEGVQNTVNAINSIVDDQVNLNCTLTVSSLDTMFSLIGPKGSNIKNLEDKYNCTIHADKRSMTVRIHGEDKESVATCKNAIETFINSNTKSDEHYENVKKTVEKKPVVTEAISVSTSNNNTDPIVPPGFQPRSTLNTDNMTKNQLKNMKRREKKRNMKNEDQNVINQLLQDTHTTAIPVQHTNTVGDSSYYTSDAGYSLDL